MIILNWEDIVKWELMKGMIRFVLKGEFILVLIWRKDLKMIKSGCDTIK